MKFLFFILLVVVMAFTGNSQNIGIGTTNPHQSSILQLSSTTRGFLPPRMTTSQRNAIVNPLNGLTVYDTDSERMYVHTDGDWKSLLNNDYWARSSTRNWVYNGSDSIGIGIASPTAKLHVNGMLRVSNDELFLSNSDMTLNKTDGIIQFQAAGNSLGFIQISGNNLRLGTNSANDIGNVIFRLNGSDRVFIDEAGRMGVGIASPTARLHVSGDINATGDLLLSGNGKVTNSATGAKDLLPLCYGRVRFMATSANLTPNVTVARLSEGVYELTCPEFNQNTTIVVTMNEYQGGFHAYPNVENWPAGSTKYRIHFHNVNTTELQDAGFSFIAYL
jgi:hypothetical protein